MLTTTFRRLHAAGACQKSYRHLAKYLGGIPTYGIDTPIPLAVIANACSLSDALWCLSLTEQREEGTRLGCLLVADFAEHVLPIFEQLCPGDTRPRRAIEAARLFANGVIDKEAAWAAREAAWAAGEATGAAGEATGAAGDAAWAAREDWQLTRFLEVAK